MLDALDASYEQWDGKGWPGELKCEDVPIASRLAVIGEFTEVALRVGGVDAAIKLVRQQRGKQFDPTLADVFETHAEILLAELDTTDTWDAVIGAEPALAVTLSDEQFDDALLAIADFIDLKSPYSLGHARAVADLVEDAGDEARDVRRRGSHGPPRRSRALSSAKLGVSNAILDKPTPLGVGERERIRMVPYLTERMLRQSPALAAARRHRRAAR